METLQKKNRMQHLISILGEGWRGFIVWGSSISIGWITGQMAMSFISNFAVLIGLLVGIFSLIGQIQKQVDRYKEKHKK